MTINISNEEGLYTVAPEGNLDYTSMEDFDAAVSEILPSASALIFNMENVPYISSAGIRVIISAYDELETKGGVKLKNCNTIVRDIFEMTGLKALLE